LQAVYFTKNPIITKMAPTYNCNQEGCRHLVGKKDTLRTDHKVVLCAFYRHMFTWHPDLFFSLPAKYHTVNNTEVTLFVGGKWTNNPKKRKWPEGLHALYDKVRASKKKNRELKKEV